MNNLALVSNSVVSDGLLYDICKIKKELGKITESFFYIGATLNEIKEAGDFGIYKNIYELANVEFDLKSTTVKNLIACYLKYRAKNVFCMKLGYKDYSLSQLVEMLPLDELFIAGHINPKMTVAEIRSLKHNFSEQSGRISDQALSEQSGRISDQTLSEHSGQISDQTLPEQSGQISDQTLSEHSGQISDQTLSEHSGQIPGQILSVEHKILSVVFDLYTYNKLLVLAKDLGKDITLSDVSACDVVRNIICNVVNSGCSHDFI